MFKHLHFPILVINPHIGQANVAGKQLDDLFSALSQEGFEVLATGSLDEGRLIAEAHRGLSCILFSTDDGNDLAPVQALFEAAHSRSPELPIIALSTRQHLDSHYLSALRDLLQLRGIIYLFEDTLPFIAGQIARTARAYLAQLLPPFFKALLDYTARSSYSWHSPGHGGGVAFRKSPVGRAFHDFLGENTLRSDLSVSVPGLGSLLDHNGPIAEAEANTARTFGADHSFYVINGTSTANKIIWHAFVSRDDVVLVDRNCHKSILHAIIMTGAIPLYLTGSRNDYGIIGPISLEELAPERLKQRLAEHPLLKDRQVDNIRLAVLTNSTYDGLCYNAELIKEQLQDAVDILHFDEAWYGYAAFHEFYAGRHGMGRNRGLPRARHPLVFATQSPHKVLAALSQASIILAQDSEEQQLDRERFNEAFMMHTSTSPHYGIIASIDVATGMMAGEPGRSLVQETLDEALSFRQAMQQTAERLDEDQWWFDVWEPEEALDSEQLQASDWTLDNGESWHGFGDMAPDYALLDPIKVTLLTPGVEEQGRLAKSGIPAAIVTRFLAERGLVVEKTGLYSFLILFSLGITKGKWSTLVSELQEFKRLYDANAPLETTLPGIAQGGHYPGLGLQDLCERLHSFYKQQRMVKILRQIYTELPDMLVRPADAYQHMVRGQVEMVPIEQLAGRISAVMLVPYPPGIPVIMPGERFPTDCTAITDYLRVAQQLDQQFPGFESDIHGLREIRQEDGSVRFCVDCLKE
ncbi:Orn/Lys/Arg decarboxylase N-terminal domain-containing protein [Halopseudomonas phragmitis]|uniref:Lysine decarboxylase n=2 Tax=Pseudomonadaceae TaxID=135621 RepID=A0A1V0B874_9GAMM|nr:MULTISPECIES: Orn/Lys/Arg decarboxylase N-terminal domain-containing protein [Pseudomonadaceae]AQZ96136.1 lysine decarboxylase [Halopseudomonas phragmitis]RHW20974.1 lysine decarboxylase [Pseudomonas jilinensis]